MLGNSHYARRGELRLCVSGDPEIVERRQASVLGRFAKQVTSVGPLGSGMSYKLILKPTGGRVYWTVATLWMPQGAEEPADGHKRLVEWTFSAHASVTELIEATLADAVMHNQIYDRPPVPSWSGEPVVLLGTPHTRSKTPVTNQGDGQGMTEAAVLAEELARLGDSESAQAAGVVFTLHSHEQRQIVKMAHVTTEELVRCPPAPCRGPPPCLRSCGSILQLIPPRVWRRG